MDNFLIGSKNIDRDGVVWNMVGSLLQAFQSVFILMVLTRQLGLVEAGIFTIAYANANLFLTIGNYGMRNYQVSDVKKENSFGAYRCSRWITSVLMVGIAIMYSIVMIYVRDYSVKKAIVIILMCIYRASDAYEDIYLGYCQQNGRLDIGAKCLTIRTFLSILTYILIVVIFKNQIYAAISIVIISYVTMTFLIMKLHTIFQMDLNYEWKRVRMLLKKCFPLFVGAFLSFYIGNAPKYAIDSQLTDEMQACYGFIAMPVFVIGLLNSFIFNPLIYKLSYLWNEGKVKKFVRLVLLQIFVVAMITIVCVIGAYIIGIPVLSFVYATNLGPYLKELLLLLVGGGFLALSGLLNAMIVILRKENTIAVVYIFVSILALMFSNPIVRGYGILGAAVLYTGLMAVVSICFAFILSYAIFKKKREV